jgi:hypothetical protein
MSRTEQALVDSAAVLEALRPFTDTGEHPELFDAAWKTAMGRLEKAAEEFVANPGAQ